MTPSDESRAGRRFLALNLARSGGVIVMLAGILVWNGSVVREGGDPLIGVPLFLVGMILSLLLPRLLTKRWRTPDA